MPCAATEPKNPEPNNFASGFLGARITKLIKLGFKVLFFILQLLFNFRAIKTVWAGVNSHLKVVMRRLMSNSCLERKDLQVQQTDKICHIRSTNSFRLVNILGNRQHFFKENLEWKKFEDYGIVHRFVNVFFENSHRCSHWCSGH